MMIFMKAITQKGSVASLFIGILSRHQRNIDKLAGPIRSLATLKHKNLNHDDTPEDPKAQEDSRFPLIKRLGLETHDKVHKINITCDDTVKFIKLGVFNKNVSLQYCHYLISICKTCNSELVSYYTNKVLELVRIIIGDRDIIMSNKLELVCHAATANRDICSKLCDLILDNIDLNSNLHDLQIQSLLSSCLDHDDWDRSYKLLKLFELKAISLTNKEIESFQNAIIESASKSKIMDNIDAKTKLRTSILRTLSLVMKICQQNNVHFVTQKVDQFIRALKDLDINVTKNPTIKFSGRCTNCDSSIQLFDKQTCRSVNASLMNLLENRIGDDLYINTHGKELTRFKAFLESIHKTDHKPVDVVLDGANIAYNNVFSYRHVRQEIGDDLQKSYRVADKNILSRVLLNCIIRNELIHKYKKIVVIGKNHMYSWPNVMEFFKKHNIYHFFSSNQSQDDLFLLYLSTLDPKTFLISNDFFRDHLSSMTNASDRLNMERWLDTHQAWVTAKHLMLTPPTPYQKTGCMDENSGRFHIPLVSPPDGTTTINFREEPMHLNKKLTTWICCDPQSANNKPHKPEI